MKFSTCPGYKASVIYIYVYEHTHIYMYIYLKIDKYLEIEMCILSGIYKQVFGFFKLVSFEEQKL